MKLLRAEYNRRAQLRPLFWDSTIQLPLEKVYTRLKIVSRKRGGNQEETERWSNVIWAKDCLRDKVRAKARATKVNPCDVFCLLKENKDVMTIVEGSPGIGKTTFCLKLAFEWANQCSSAASFPEFELVLLLKCRDIDGELTEAITRQLFPKDMSKDAREELFRFMEDVKHQERVLIILDGLNELAEKSKHFVDDLLHRERWACCYVLATTRQEKGIEVRKQPEFVFNLFLQIEGFTEEDSFEYIRKHFKIVGPEHSSKGEKLIEESKGNELLRDLQKNPLNLLLLCIVYEDHEGNLPSTRTKLKLNKSKLKLNKSKTDLIYLYSRHNLQTSLPPIQFGNDSIIPTEAVRNVGAIFDSTLSMVPQVNSLCKTASYHLRNIARIRHLLSKESTEILVHAFVFSKLDYCNALLYGLPQCVIKKLQLVQNSAARLITCSRKYDHTSPLLIQLHWLPITQRIWFKVLLLTFKAIHKLSPVYLQELISKYSPSRKVRSSDAMLLERHSYNLKTYGSRAFRVAAPELWNKLPREIKLCDDIDSFKKKLKTYLFNIALN